MLKSIIQRALRLSGVNSVAIARTKEMRLSAWDGTQYWRMRAHHNVEIIRQDKDVFYKNYQGQKPGLFFCDANHDYQPTLDDLTWARAIGAKIICGHDYDPIKFPGVVRTVRELGGPSKIVGSIFVL